MTGDTHYDLEILAEFAEGLLDDNASARIRGHLAVCDVCGEGLADLAGVREVLAAVPVPAMPLGVAMRIDRALADEAARFRESSPWELQPQKAQPWEEELVPAFGVVGDDGVISAPKRARRRRAWMMPVASAAAAAVVVGSAAVATGLLGGSGGGVIAGPQLGGPETTPGKSPLKAAATYVVRESNHNYTSRELNGPLLGYFAPGPGAGSNVGDDLNQCVQQKANELDRSPIAVDRAFYNGNEATIMAFWEDKSINAVRVVVVDDSCQSLRPEGLARWN